MYFFNLCQQILSDMWARKMRSFLALFGIIWGTFTVVMLLALGTGFRSANEKNMMRIVDGVFFVMPGQTSKSFHGLPKGQVLNIKSNVVMDLKKNLPVILKVSPMMTNRTTVNSERANIRVNGVSDDFGYLRKINLDNGGRFINILDIKNKNRVVVLGDKLKSRVFW